ncbi:MAG: DUF2141 domain-containing protein [Minwuia sp.]|nr:DUF2141 domain-containing protein [Minwuia sp.]
MINRFSGKARHTPRRMTFTLACTVLTMAVGQTATAGDLQVSVTGVRDDAGAIRIALYHEASTFLKAGEEHAAMFRKAGPGDLTFIFGGLPGGRYAVAIYHDQNANGELDTNLLGIPLEGIAFSEGATATFSAPSFDDAAIMVPTEGQARTQARLSY